MQRTSTIAVARSARPRRGEHEPLVAVLAAACAGIVLDRAMPFSFGAWWLLAAAAWILWWLAWRGGQQRAAAMLTLLSVAAAGAVWHHCHWNLYQAHEIGLFAHDGGGPAALEVRATSGPRRVPAPPPDPLRTIATPDRTRLEVEVLAVRDADNWRPARGASTLFVDGHLLGVRAGDRLRVFAQLNTNAAPQNPGEFDFSRLARAERQLCQMRSEFPECVTLLSAARGWSWSRTIDALRTAGDAALWRSLSPARAGLASAMFLGSREELDADESQAFMETGTIHLLVISGLNVGILASCLFLAMRVLLVPRGWALAVVALATVAYAATTDAQPPVVRATVMVLIGCAAMVLGRRALAYNSIAAAGLVVLAINPAELFDSGTQLSFLSVGVLAWLSRRQASVPPPDALERLIASSRAWHERLLHRLGAGLARMCVASLVIWLVVCPLVMARFHLVSPVAVLLGPVLSLPVTLAMGSGFGILALGWLWTPAAQLLGGICDWNLSFMEACVMATRGWSAGHAWVAGPSEWWLGVFYAALACWALVPRLTPPPRWCLALVAGWVSLGLVLPLARGRDVERLDCTFLSVGHGAAVVLELPGGRTVLYDGGRLGSPAAASRAVAGFLWSRGITHLDAIVISHADADHYNALPAIVERFSVGAVYVSPVMFDHPNGAVRALERSLQRAGLPVREVWSGDRLRTQSAARIEVLHPPRAGVLGSDNANSIVLAIEYQGRRVLLTGDLESPGLDDVMAELPLDCDVVLTPHHGSAFSDPPGTGNLSGGKKENQA